MFLQNSLSGSGKMPRRSLRSLIILLLKRQSRLERRLLRDNSNPFSIPGSRFRRLFGFPPLLAKEFIDELDVLVDDQQPRVPKHLQVLCVLDYLANGEYRKPLGVSAFRRISQGMVAGFVHKITRLIIQQLAPKYMHLPADDAEASAIKNKFLQSTNLPGIIGVIDGLHIHYLGYEQQRAPNYLNKKKYPSILAMMICDADSRVLHCDPSYGGAGEESDIFEIWNDYISRHVLKLNEQNPQTWLFGDVSYTLMQHLIAPFKYPNSPEENKFNEIHGRVRSRMNKCWAMLRGQWKCLSYEKPLQCSHIDAYCIINAVCICHNYMINHNVRPVEAEFVDTNQPRDYMSRKRKVQPENREYLMRYIAETGIE